MKLEPLQAWIIHRFLNILLYFGRNNKHSFTNQHMQAPRVGLRTQEKKRERSITLNGKLRIHEGAAHIN